MTSWPHEPPDPETITPLRLLRAPPKTTLGATIISSNVQGALTHYNGSRTMRCPRVGCPECEKHHVPRWYGYVGVFNPVSNSTALFEFPAGPYATVREYLAKYHTLVGANLKAWRKPARENGPVFLSLQPPIDPSLKYPPAPDIMKILCRMWGLNYEAERRLLLNQQTKELPPPAAPVPDDPEASTDLIDRPYEPITTSPKPKLAAGTAKTKRRGKNPA